ncbi:T9SS type A sorting domain-containing protein [Flavobacterium sp. RHBU_24]|uniref:T9SS type A sorting domain-containing protein n=1 Tax=Flavobacterium sp. RHBU_24 TaxID=3391185 RepID=UPI00398461A8
MKSKITLFAVFFTSLFVNAQVEFEDHLVMDNSLYVQSPNSVFSADLDGDGDSDVLTSSYYGGRLVWLENLDGAGGDFAAHTISSEIQNAWGVYAADLDADGDVDAIVASSLGNTITWFENTDGNGTFVLKQATYAFRANFVMAADIDNDTDLDIIWSSSSEGDLKGFKNTDGLGTLGNSFNIETNTSRIPGFHPADIDGDGDLDIVSSYSIQGGSQGVTWYKNTNGTGSFGAMQLISNAVNSVMAVHSGDIDGDGDMDVVSASAGDDKIAWYENVDGAGTFGPQQVLSVTADAASVVRLADVDGDGDLDVAFGSNTDQKIGWFENTDGLGNFSGEIFIGPNSGDIRSMDFFDVDADGDLDFLTATNIDNNITLFKNTNGEGVYAPAILTKHIDGGRVVVAEDIDGDGDKDLVAASYWDDKVSWFKNLDGNGNFYNTQVIISDTVNGAESVFAGNVDNDGFADVLATSRLEDKIVWFKNTDGLGNFAPPQIIDDNLYLAYRVYLSDIDNDGDQDIFGLGSGRITWYENLDNQGTFSAQQTIDNINNFAMYAVDFGDLDGDGDLDISVASNYGLLYYLNLNGQGTFSTRQIIEDGSYESVSTKIADIDNDGDNDIVYTGENSASAFVGWSQNLNGSGNFGGIQVITTIITDPKSVVVADFDNDGDTDVASSAAGDGGVVAWYENTDGQGNFENTQQIISQSLNSPFDMFAADIDNNNTVDIVSISEHDDKIVWHQNSGAPVSNSINGTVRFDLLGDGCTEADAVLSGILLVASDNTGTNATFSQENGQYQIYTTGVGTVTTQITSQLPAYYEASPSSFESDFAGYGNTDEANFCVTPQAAINDLAVSFYPIMNDPRPGFDTGYRMVYRNIGTTQLSGTVSFEYDGSKLSFLNATETVSSQSANAIAFDFTGLNPFEVKTIDLRFNVFAPPITNIDDVLITTATINPVEGDYTEDDNVISYNQIVVGSYDPNDITCIEGDEVLIENADKYLHYLIRFQNTGTASAINVRVDHVLDDKLDWSTMQLESLSHDGRVNIHNGSDVSFIFNNINLPDSSSNEPDSHGFIAYRIKPKHDVAVGDIIQAAADIYFDFNPPIITNTAVTAFTEALAVKDFKQENIKVYPNPANGILNIDAANKIISIAIYNHLGQRVLSAKETSTINIAALPEGVYVMTLQDDNGTVYTQKIIKK